MTASEISSRFRPWIVVAGGVAVVTTLLAAWSADRLTPRLVVVTVVWFALLAMLLRWVHQWMWLVPPWFFLTLTASALLEPPTGAMLLVLFLLISLSVAPLPIGIVIAASAVIGIVGIRLHIEGSDAALGSSFAAVQILLIVAVVVALRTIAAERGRARSLAKELLQRNEELQRTNARIDRLAAEAERARLARSLHDELGHTLTTVGVFLRVARRDLNTSTHTSTLSAITRAEAATQRGLDELRECVGMLRSRRQQTPLEPAVRSLVRSLPEHPRVRVTSYGQAVALGPQYELALYRLAQEAITNALKHSETDTIDVTIRYGLNAIDLSVRDDGCGWTELVEGFGIRGMRDRMGAVGGRFRIHSEGAQRGAVVEARLPFNGEAERSRDDPPSFSSRRRS